MSAARPAALAAGRMCLAALLCSMLAGAQMSPLFGVDICTDDGDDPYWAGELEECCPGAKRCRSDHIDFSGADIQTYACQICSHSCPGDPDYDARTCVEQLGETSVSSFHPYPGYNAADPFAFRVSGTVAVTHRGFRKQMLYSLTGADTEGHLAIHKGMSCDNASAIGGHYYTEDPQDEDPRFDPWIRHGRYGERIEPCGPYITCIGRNSISSSLVLAHFLGHAVVVTDRNGVRIACGLLSHGAPIREDAISPPVYTAVVVGDRQVGGRQHARLHTVQIDTGCTIGFLPGATWYGAEHCAYALQFNHQANFTTCASATSWCAGEVWCEAQGQFNEEFGDLCCVDRQHTCTGFIGATNQTRCASREK